MKSFFIVLFMFGFLTPALPSSPGIQLQRDTHQINIPDHQPILINLFSELINENEESKEDDESSTLIIEEYPTLTFCLELLNSGKPSDLHKTCHPYSHPDLFEMYGEYLI